MSSSSRVLVAPVALVAAAGLGLLVAMSACGGSHHPNGTPMPGSAAILPSPVRAERVPAGDEGSSAATSASPVPSSSSSQKP